MVVGEGGVRAGHGDHGNRRRSGDATVPAFLQGCADGPCRLAVARLAATHGRGYADGDVDGHRDLEDDVCQVRDPHEGADEPDRSGHQGRQAAALPRTDLLELRLLSSDLGGPDGGPQAAPREGRQRPARRGRDWQPGVCEGRGDAREDIGRACHDRSRRARLEGHRHPRLRPFGGGVGRHRGRGGEVPRRHLRHPRVVQVVQDAGRQAPQRLRL
mmetsp:Transcript_97967/g.272575  ORF Transcript_97967/g.272575 Transcript_97967/m.272575 type:complete len:215 (+) Transcript_97967:255-899(+)